MTVATPVMQRRAIPAQKEAPWGLVELLTAAANVVDGVAWLEVEAGKAVDVGIVVIATFPDDVDETELGVASGVEVTGMEADICADNDAEGRADTGSAEVAICWEPEGVTEANGLDAPTAL